MRRRASFAMSALLGAIVLDPASADASERFRYVDREGHVHYVAVASDGEDLPPPPAVLAPIAPNETQDPSGVPYIDQARVAASSYGLPVALVVAVMKVESGFNPRAVSSKGAMGLMQLMPPTAAEMGVVDPFDPRQSLLGGARFLRQLMDQFDGDLTRTLSAYNAGAGRVRRGGGAIPFDETRRYVSNILRLYGEYTISGLDRTPPGQLAVGTSEGPARGHR